MTLFLADLTIIAHALFIVFVILGGLFVLKWPKVMWLHIPCAIYGALIEFFGWICPLTYLENYLRHMANADTYQTSFVQQYLLPIIYPTGLTTDIQLILGSLVILVNSVIYFFVWKIRINN